MMVQASNEISTPRKKHAAFTLVELLVAIAIFAVLSALGWKIFDHLIKIKERNSQHEQAIEQLQDAYQQIQRDALQLVPLNATVAGQTQAAVYLNNQKLSLSKSGVSDPLKQGLAPDERIEYYYNADEKKLYRLKYPYLDSARSDQPMSSVLLNQVDQYEVRVLNPDEIAQWPAVVVHPNDRKTLKSIPRGLRFKITIQDVEYDWIFHLNHTDFLSQSLQYIKLSPQRGTLDSLSHYRVEYLV